MNNDTTLKEDSSENSRNVTETFIVTNSQRHIFIYKQ